jgi:hypothetical protein
MKMEKETSGNELLGYWVIDPIEETSKISSSQPIRYSLTFLRLRHFLYGSRRHVVIVHSTGGYLTITTGEGGQVTYTLENRASKDNIFHFEVAQQQSLTANFSEEFVETNLFFYIRHSKTGKYLSNAMRAGQRIVEESDYENRVVFALAANRIWRCDLN